MPSRVGQVRLSVDCIVADGHGGEGVIKQHKPMERLIKTRGNEQPNNRAGRGGASPRETRQTAEGHGSQGEAEQTASPEEP
eukprot:9677394-Heterocapsa_arctica.AAC.1